MTRKTVLLLTLFFISATTARVAASVRSFEKLADGLLFTLDKGFLNIKVCGDDIVEVKYTVLGSFPSTSSLVVNYNWPLKPAFSVKDAEGWVTITTSRLIVRVSRATEAITYLDAGGSLVAKEDEREGKSMEAQTVAGINTFSCASRWVSPSDEALYGLGCHPLDSLSINYKGRDQDMAIKYLTGAIPVLLSTRGYGLLWDNYSASKFFGAEGGNTKFRYVSESGRQLDYYFFYGPGFDHIIDLFRTASGKAPMFAKWAFGLFQSQDRYKTQAEILSVKDNYRNNHIPVDAIVQDWFYWEPLPIGSHVMNAERYPDPRSLVDQLHKANLHAMISIWPVFGAGTPDFDALKKIGGLTSITWDNFVTKTFDTYYDAHNPAARDLYWQQARDSLVGRYGWDGWWVDQCEPDNGSLLDERRKADLFTGKGIDYFNTYSLEHSEGLYKNWRRDIAGKRAFFLIRQAFAGQQRNAATLWSSDITTTFASLRNQVPQAINACVSGIPYWTSDIGGYISYGSPAGVPDWSDPKYRELFVRWFQFGAFSPIFRIHGKGERALFSRNWDEDTRAILLKFDALRYRLLPYIYSLAARVTGDNYTIMRSLAFDFRTDPKVYNIPDQYMFGPAFMVCPVTERMYTGDMAGKGTGTRKIYMPVADGAGTGRPVGGSGRAGTGGSADWFDFWTGERLSGGSVADAPAPLDRMPLYVRAGSILPMGLVMEYATEKAADSIELRIYPGADGKFVLYEDENDNYNYEKGQSATIGFSWNDRLRQLTISERKGSFPGMLTSRVFNVVIVQQGKGVGELAVGTLDRVVKYSGKELVVALP